MHLSGLTHKRNQLKVHKPYALHKCSFMSLFASECSQSRTAFSPQTPDTSKGAAEQKARSTYEYLIDLAEDPDVLAPLRFLREREVVHFQRFGEALEIARDHLNQKHWFFQNQ